MTIRRVKNNSGKDTFEVYVSGTNVRGKRVQKLRRGLETKRQAEKIEFQLKRELAKLREDAVPFTWDEWFAICLEKMRIELKPSTVMEYTAKNTHWIKPHFQGKEIASITPRDVHDVVFNPDKQAAWYTRKTVLKHIKRILTLAVDEGLIPRNPALSVKVKVPQAKQAVLNKTEVDLLLQRAKAVGHRFYPVWTMALLTGMRSGELYALKWTDVDLEGDKIHVVRSWSSKNGCGPTKTAQNRIVPVSGELKELLRELKIRHQKGSEYVLPRLQEWKSGYQAQVLGDFCEGLGITKVRFHDLRATFITRLLNQGVPVAVVMAIVGHNQIKTTQAYLRLAGLELEGATDKLGFSVPQGHEAKVIDLVSMK